jgi:hypothetical protein
MAISIKVHHSPEEYRRTELSVERYHAEVGMSIHSHHPFIVGGSMGVGKTHGLLAYLRSKLWRTLCAAVVLLYYTHRQLTEIEKALDGSGLVVRRYPPRDPERCGDNDAAMSYYESLRLPLLAKVEVCQTCPARKGCPYLERSKPSWARGADVILAPEQLLPVFPDVLQVWSTAVNIGSSVSKPLLVGFDEAKVADTGFYREFLVGDLDREAQAATSCQQYAVADFLDAVIRQPAATNGLIAPSLQPKDLIRLQRRGVERFDRQYRSVFDLAVDYTLRPVWHEAGTYCVARFPRLPATTVFIGAFLDPLLIARRMDVPMPRIMGDGSLVLHPASRLINVASAIGFQKFWPSNRMSITNFTADVVARNRAAGRSTVIIGRKDAEDG